jgi:hypothetical protein
MQFWEILLYLAREVFANEKQAYMDCASYLGCCDTALAVPLRIALRAIQNKQSTIVQVTSGTVHA